MPLSERFDRALDLAHELHRTQVRKGTQIPYVAHLMSVSALVAENGGNEDQVIAALLHDAVEDQGGEPTAQRIREAFGDVVHRIVMGCTDSVTDDPKLKKPWRERKEAYLAHLAEAPIDMRLVSAADKVHNARSIVQDLRVHGPSTWDRFKGGKDGSLWYYRTLVQQLRKGWQHPIIDLLEREVREMEQLAG
jgi:(p)ppGpp synthase/HD superfamily hydrolase